MCWQWPSWALFTFLLHSSFNIVKCSSNQGTVNEFIFAMVSCLRFILDQKLQWPKKDLNCESLIYNAVTTPIRPYDTIAISNLTRTWSISTSLSFFDYLGAYKAFIQSSANLLQMSFNVSHGLTSLLKNILGDC